MNNNWISRNWWMPVLFAGTALSSFTFFDMDEPGSVNPPQQKFKLIYAQLKDTIPGEKEMDNENRGFHFKTGDIDRAIAQIEKEMLKAREELRKTDFKKTEVEMQRALKELEQSFDHVKWEKMEKELKESLQKIEETDLPGIRKNLQEQLAKELSNTKEQLANTKKELEIQKEKMKDELGKGLAGTMKNFDELLPAYKEQLKTLNEMVKEMEKDGLIQKGENADIKYKQGLLYINGQKQSKEITDKYRHYFKKANKQIVVNKDDDGWL